MINKLIKHIKIPALFLVVFALYWFVNSGFLTDPLWLVMQAGLFTVVTFIIFKYRKIKLIYWFLVIGIFYVLSSVFEIFELGEMSVIAASTGFGILIISILVNSLRQ